MSKDVSRATAIVQRVHAMYPKALASVQAYLGDIPYGIERVDPRAADRRLMQLTADDVAQIAATDPVRAQGISERLDVLDTRAASAPAFPDDYEG